MHRGVRKLCAGIKIALLNAAFEGAFHTAQINVVYMKDPDRKAHAEKALAELQNRFDGQKTSDSHL